MFLQCSQQCGFHKYLVAIDSAAQRVHCSSKVGDEAAAAVICHGRWLLLNTGLETAGCRNERMHPLGLQGKANLGQRSQLQAANY